MEKSKILMTIEAMNFSATLLSTEVVDAPTIDATTFRLLDANWKIHDPKMNVLKITKILLIRKISLDFQLLRSSKA